VDGRRPRDLPGRNVENPYAGRRVEVARRAGLNPGVAALGQQRRQPPDLQFTPHHHQQVGVVQLENEAGLGFDEVRILIAAGQRLDAHLVAADLADQRGEIFSRGDDLGRRRRGGRSHRPGQRREDQNQSIHDAHH
jgi:hypothetical protein